MNNNGAQATPPHDLGAPGSNAAASTAADDTPSSEFQKTFLPDCDIYTSILSLLQHIHGAEWTAGPEGELDDAMRSLVFQDSEDSVKGVQDLEVPLDVKTQACERLRKKNEHKKRVLDLYRTLLESCSDSSQSA